MGRWRTGRRLRKSIPLSTGEASDTNSRRRFYYRRVTHRGCVCIAGPGVAVDGQRRTRAPDQLCRPAGRCGRPQNDWSSVTFGLADAGWQNLLAGGESMMAIIAYRTVLTTGPTTTAAAATVTGAVV